MKNRTIFWGVILIIIGILFILKNFNVFIFSWFDILHLWPVLLILIGISLLPIKNTAKLILSVVALVLTVIILAYSPGYWRDHAIFRFPCERWVNHEKWDYDDWSEQHINEPYSENIQQAKLVFDAAAGTFKVKDVTSDLIEFQQEGNLGTYEFKSIDVDDRKVIKIGLKGTKIRRGTIKNRVFLKLNTNPVWDLEFNVGAAKLEMDLSPFKINSLDIDGGAASIEVRLGDLADNTEINIDAGASSIVIKIPENVACEINTDTFLSTKDLKGFNKIGKNTYISENFADCDKNINIEIDAAVSSLKIIRY
jgi:hypothetical protein